MLAHYSFVEVEVKKQVTLKLMLVQVRMALEETFFSFLVMEKMDMVGM